MSLVNEIQLNLLNHDKKNAKKIQPGIQSQVGFRSCKKSKNACAELSMHFEVNPDTISKWKTEFLENMSSFFGGEKGKIQDEDSTEMEKLYAQIGQLKVENDFLKKSARRLGIPESEWK